MFHILVVEDNVNTQKLLHALLAKEGYDVTLAKDGQDGLDQIEWHHIDLVLLDVMMPKMNGYEFTKELRASNNDVPILMLTARQLVDDKKEGFLAGADDYLTKPFDHEELLLRMKALLRRAHSTSERVITIKDITLHYDSLSISRAGVHESIPQKEFLVLYKLVSSPGRIFTRLQIMDEIWGVESESGDMTVNVHINRLRNRLEAYPEIEVVTVRGLGYKAVLHL